MDSQPSHLVHQSDERDHQPLGTSPKPVNFLSLPYKVRMQIYYEAGLQSFGNDTTDHNSIVRLNPAPGPTPFRIYELVSSLLLVSRAISEEIIDEFYSSNWIQVHASGNGGLRALSRLSDRALSAVTYLIVEIRACHCPERFAKGLGPQKSTGSSDDEEEQEDNDLHFHHSCEPFHSKHMEPLDIAKPEDAKLIQVWAEVASRLAEHAQPTLELELLCDCVDAATANAVVTPLYDLPILDTFGIRLAKYHNKGLQAFADAVHDRITGRSPTSTFHRWNDLSVEVRLRILEYTGLVTDNEEVFWHPRWGYFMPQSITSCRVAACRSSHTAASTQCLAERCDNHLIIRSLFLVSKQMKTEASTIFFSKNSFVVMPRIGVRGLEDRRRITSNNTQEVELFLNNIGRSNINKLRRLEIVIAHPEYPCFGEAARSYLSWLRAVELLRGSANLPTLTLSFSYFSSPDDDRRNQQRVLRKTMQILTVLKGLKDFWVHEWSKYVVFEHREIYETELRAREERLEKIVMGEEYDALTRGKDKVMEDHDFDDWLRHDPTREWIFHTN
ncbi:hypothetical protein HYFRA_00002003 [Hymenoscyphus fraxineus]|uniref:Uncharacterized protein n=1 Tax=Hymenoscyphus fraxineus TaxID=746836 RepID=A0A9N9KKF6_9HELO|nr:hypothetical protein HYFRA_00002003 [Hymenoscyphus fraxineus]